MNRLLTINILLQILVLVVWLNYSGCSLLLESLNTGILLTWNDECGTSFGNAYCYKSNVCLQSYRKDYGNKWIFFMLVPDDTTQQLTITSYYDSSCYSLIDSIVIQYDSCMVDSNVNLDI